MAIDPAWRKAIRTPSGAQLNNVPSIRMSRRGSPPRMSTTARKYPLPSRSVSTKATRSVNFGERTAAPPAGAGRVVTVTCGAVDDVGGGTGRGAVVVVLPGPVVGAPPAGAVGRGEPTARGAVAVVPGCPVLAVESVGP